MNPMQHELCVSGKHRWTDPEDRRRCCAGYVRVQGTTRAELEAAGAEHVVFRQLWRGWVPEPRPAVSG
jgi:hypothetical protein